MDYFVIRVMLSAFCVVIYYVAANSKTTHRRTAEVFSSNYSCDQYAHIDNITLKVLFSNIHQRSKAHFLVITHRGDDCDS